MSVESESDDSTSELRLENIPDDLKERDQWLLWDTESDRKQPHWRGNFAISWSDPDDWHTFDEAVEAAAERESWKVGYVTAVESTNYDGGEYGVIDIDGGVLENGDLKDWVPSIERFEEELMTYIEYSPSGTGLHIPFRGEVPSWWRDGQVGDHEGVDVLANKFCTFTGIKRGNGLIVSDFEIESWLHEAYESIHGEYPNTVEGSSGSASSSESITDDDVMDREMVEDALDHLDPDTSHTEWINIAYAVHDWDSSSDGQRVFEGWSKNGSKYDKEAQDQIDRIWERAEKGSASDDDHITVAYLVYKARKNGWSPDFPSPANGDGLSSSIETQNGMYGTVEYDRDGEPYFDNITTFTIEVNARLDDPRDRGTKVSATVIPASGTDPSYDVTFGPSIFNDVRTFKEEICTGMTTAFSGGFEELNQLRMHILDTDVPEYKGTRKLGTNGDELVTPNGVYDSDWSSEDAKHQYIDSGAAMEENWLLGDDGEYEEEEVARICELISQTRETERGYPAIGWSYASLVAHWIHDWEGEMPMLTVTGDAGAGKSVFIEQLVEMTGVKPDPHSPDSSKFNHISLLSGTTNLPIWYDEYKPSELSNYKQGIFQNLLRRATRGGKEGRGNRDHSTKSFRLAAPVILSGEQSIQGPAEERRSIQTQLKKSTRNKTHHAQAFAELQGGSFDGPNGYEYYDGLELTEHAKAVHQFVLDLDKEETHETWKDSIKHVYEILNEEGITGVGGLEEQSLQMIKFGVVLYQYFANSVGADMSHIDNDDIDDAIVYVARKMGDENRTSHVDEFIGLVAAAISDGEMLRGREFEVVNEGKANEELRLKTEKAHHIVSKYVRDHALDGYDLLNKASDYKGRMGDMVDSNDSYVIDTGVNTRGLNRCVAIDTHRAEEVVENFDRESLVF